MQNKEKQNNKDQNECQSKCQDVELSLMNFKQSVLTNINSETFSNGIDNNLLNSEKQEQQNDKNKSTDFEAGVNLFKSFIGSGILGLPFAFQKAGYILASLTLVVICSIIMYCSFLVFKIYDQFEQNNYQLQDLILKVLGIRGQKIYRLFLILAQIGVCASYIIFFTTFFEIALKTTDMPFTQYIYFGISMTLIIPLIMINNIHFFQKYSKIANIFTLLTLVVIIIYAINHIVVKPNYNSEHNYSNFKDLAGFLGIAIYSFEAIGTMFYIKNSMQKPKNFDKLFYIIIMIVCSLCTFFSAICSIAWGKEIKQIVLIGLTKYEDYFLIFSALYAVNLIFSYPIQFFPIQDNLSKLKISQRYNYLLRIFVTIIIGIFAFVVPQFSTMLNLTGAVAGVTLQFFFPIIMYHSYFSGKISVYRKIINFLILIFACFCSIFSINDSISQLLK